MLDTISTRKVDPLRIDRLQIIQEPVSIDSSPISLVISGEVGSGEKNKPFLLPNFADDLELL